MENNKFSILCNIWDKIGPFDMDRFSDRLILQKKVFLLQEMGLDLGYIFSKYVYGPYCSELANDGFKIRIKENLSSNPSCDSDPFLEKLKELEKGHKGDSSWFELLGTITYLRNKTNRGKEEIKKIIEEEKPYLFEEKLFSEAYSILIKVDIISS